ncbi:hypothetical protein U732_1223 [Clostridium argentinense CDC 2741]|uniref:Cxxc_20_cxxc family protein n=1 Tax=Clostridium argentinense CDC 2741 TaxID=1418104 RepID=A0A0C1R0H4_9CLOT|nr:hypothetical protein [Clostridium argentinense]ARC85552.1 hypothetical protein RSJ17_14085 [Clostridium argentinense]KIE46897.1 hypothetical protein U732_1223 [Clostridium argentinense CDC 2741]NFF40066.1 hypothetical protein [Clostridium argentinense]NFP50234.1 hypothetical protein [Clostridium argentinense]NFP71875.1 hypothetical protein [Clostridium argentinense]
MIHCPNCNNKISSRKVICLTNFNNIQCKKCGRYLTFNKRKNFLPGVILTIIGALILPYTICNFIYNNFGIIDIVLILLWISLGIFFTLKFTKLEIDEEYEKYYK